VLQSLGRSRPTRASQWRRAGTWACDTGGERREERQVFGRGGTATLYQMRQKILSIGDDYWIENAEGQRVYRVDGKATVSVVS
jgi:hypothetical protein